MDSKKVQEEKAAVDLGLSQQSQQPSRPTFDLGIFPIKQTGEEVQSESSRSKRKSRDGSVDDDVGVKRGRRVEKAVIGESDADVAEDDNEDSDGSSEADDDDEPLLSEDYDSPGLTQDWIYINADPFVKDIRFACSTNKNIFSVLKKKLSRVVYDRFMKSCFGIYNLIPDMSHQGPIHRVIFESAVRSSNREQLWIVIGRKVLKFTLKEFCLITGLRCDTNEQDFDYDGQPTCRFIRRYFPGRETVTKGALMAAFEGKVWGDNQDDALKFGILVFIADFLFSLTLDARIPSKFFYVVDCGHYADYPWGKAVYKELMRCYNKPVRQGQKSCRLFGFPYALQCWIYECCSDVPANVAKHVKEDVPRILNWEVQAKNLMYSDVKSNLFDSVEFENIFPFINELDTLPLPAVHGLRGATRTPQAGPSALQELPGGNVEAEASVKRSVKGDDGDDDFVDSDVLLNLRSRAVDVATRSTTKRTARKNIPPPPAVTTTYARRPVRNKPATEHPPLADVAEAGDVEVDPNPDAANCVEDVIPLNFQLPIGGDNEDHSNQVNKGKELVVKHEAATFGEHEGASKMVGDSDTFIQQAGSFLQHAQKNQVQDASFSKSTTP